MSDATTEQPAARPGLLRANIGVATGTLLSRLTGLLRVVALTWLLSDGAASVAYNLANVTPNIVYELLLGGILTATLVPLFTDELAAPTHEGTDAIISVSVVSLFALTLVAVLAAPIIVGAYDPSPEVRPLAIAFAYLFLPQIFFYGLMALGSALLNARGRFLAAAWTPVLNNVVVIGVLLAAGRVVTKVPPSIGELSTHTGPRLLLGIGTTAGIAAMAIALVPSLLRAGVRVRFRPAFRHPAVRRLVRLSGWTFGYVVANQLCLLVVNRLAGDGLSRYQYAFIFFQLPHGLLAVSITTTFGTELARSISRRSRAAFEQYLTRGLRLIALLTIPASFGYIALARPVVGLLRRGAFDAAAANRTASVLAAFAAGLVGFSTYLFVMRAFYARKDTRTPFIVNIIENLINAVLAVPFVRWWGIPGLALSLAVAYLAAAILALAVLHSRIGGFPVRAVVDPVVRMALAGGVMYLWVAAVEHAIHRPSGLGAVASCLAGSVVGIVVYGAGLHALGVPDLASVRRLLNRRAA